MMFFNRRLKVNAYRSAAAKYRLQRRSESIVRDIATTCLSLLVIAVLTALLIYGHSYLLSAPYFRTHEVLVRGCEELTEKDVLALAGIQPSQSLLIVNVEELARRIRINPWVKDVSVGREYPDRVVIEIRERKPVALLKQEADFYLLDANGTAFKKLETGDGMDLPVLTGFYNSGKTDTALLAKALQLLKRLDEGGHAPNIGKVSEIHGHERQGISLITNTGLCLLLGNENFDNKFKYLPVVMADLSRRNRKAGFMQIDLSDPLKVTVQQRNILVPAETTPPRARLKT